jgi:hypothetical protein
MKWLDLIDKFPSEEDYEKAWFRLFQYYPKDCAYTLHTKGIGIIVSTPTTTWAHGGFIHEYTDEPTFLPPNMGCIPWYSGCGCSWNIDDNGKPYHLIDKNSGFPVNWEEVQAIEIIKNYWKTKKITDRDKSITKVLEVPKNISCSD